MKEGTVVEWLRHELEPVKKGDPIAVISSDKIEKEIETPEDGYLIKINAKENDVVPIGTTIGIIGVSGEAIPDTEIMQRWETKDIAAKVQPVWSNQGQEQPPKTKILISPSARKLAVSLGIEVDKIQGTGPNGRITNDDIRRAAEEMVRAEPLITEKMPEIDPYLHPATIKPLSNMRRTIANRLRESLQNTAQLTITMKADLTELERIRKLINAQLQNRQDTVKLTVTDFIAKAVTLALQSFPIMNSALLNNKLHLYDEIHLGIAVSIEGGLVVPVIKNTEKLSMSEISQAIRSLRQKARDKQLELNEISGATFSITNLGRTGIEYFTPVLNAPETGILGIGTSTNMAIFQEDGTISSKAFLPLSLTFDHQVTDGNPASEFLAKIKYYLENPLMMLI